MISIFKQVPPFNRNFYTYGSKNDGERRTPADAIQV